MIGVCHVYRHFEIISVRTGCSQVQIASPWTLGLENGANFQPVTRHMPVPHPTQLHPGLRCLCLLGRLFQKIIPLAIKNLIPNFMAWSHKIWIFGGSITCFCFSPVLAGHGDPGRVPCPAVGQGVPQLAGTTQFCPVLSNGHKEPAAALADWCWHRLMLRASVWNLNAL